MKDTNLASKLIYNSGYLDSKSTLPENIKLSDKFHCLNRNKVNFYSPGNPKEYLQPFSTILKYLISPSTEIILNNPIDQTWEDKLKIARLKISSLANTFYQRELIKRDNIWKIDEDICKIHTQQFTLAKSPSFDKYSINMDQIGLEKTICSLEHEKRSEITNFWKDILMIQKDFIEALNEYLSLKRKMDLLGITAKGYPNG